MNYKKMPEVYADVKTIFVRQEIRSGHPFKAYAHYPFLGDRGYFGSCIMEATLENFAKNRITFNYQRKPVQPLIKFFF